MGLTRDVTFPTPDGLTLEGVLHLPPSTPGPGAVVCHPHPLYGGDMHNNVVVALCRALAARGIAVLRFNFRGVGRSQGAFGDGAGEQQDAAAALAFLRSLPELDTERLALAGYSFGAAVALLAAGGQGLRAVVGVSVPTIARGLPELSLSCPVLLVVGERDEVAPPPRLAGLASLLGPAARVEVVPGADHFWWGHEGALAALVGDFLAGHLAPAAPK
ncbi:MAG TPA: alpha/beta family hydrolase [Dehalococcoidia bacterium]|nr:alpha/beta family hydrolase [Dehalococcoidia bacterium]